MRPTHLETRYKHDLSPRQREVLELIARGQTNAEIADALGISLDGAKYHVREILAKLGVDSREEAVQEWRRMRSPLGRLRHLVLAGLGSLAKSAPLLAAVGLGAAVAAGGTVVAVVSLTGADGQNTLVSADVAATATPTAEPTATPTPGGAYDGTRRDAEEYARQLGISVDEAVERLRMAGENDYVFGTLTAVAPDRVAGTWIRHTPTFGLVIWYTGPDEGLDDAWAIAARSSIPVEIRTGARHSERELRSQVQPIMRAIGHESLVGGGVNVSLGAVFVLLLEDSAAAADPDALRERLETEFGVPVVLELSGPPWQPESDGPLTGRTP